ncbi:hypothetical protein MSPP1_000272 [Malassezia sp. CBS 17886]|nr:hypothetical protein MSPP1_000272 [Malassezia sp. CBS 17886]
MIRSGSQQALDGPCLALLLLTAFYCHVEPLPEEPRAPRALVLFLVRALESLDAPPHSLDAMKRRLRGAFAEFPATHALLCTYLDEAFLSFDSPDSLAELFHARLVDCLVADADDTDEAMPRDAAQPPLDRRSYLGLFVRRARVAYEMLLDNERLELTAVCAAWRTGKSARGDEWIDNPHARAYAVWRAAERRGDYPGTKNALHAFFDLTLPGCDQELHQHALLNLARFYLDTHGYAAARTTLDEAILLARAVGDTECMRACDHLLDQLAYVDPRHGGSHGWLLTRLETDDALACSAYSPLVLWKAEMQRQRGRPLLGLVQMLADTTWASRSPFGAPQPLHSTHQPGPDWEPRPSVERSAALPSAVLARTWLQLGIPSVAHAYIAHVRRQPRTAHAHSRCMMLSAAVTAGYADAERGAYDAALHRLVEPATVELLDNMAQYHAWHPALWHILFLRARRQGHAASMRRLREMAPDEAGHPHQSLETLMRSLAQSERQHLFPAYRMGLALLGEIMVTALPMPEEARRTVEEALPHALADANGEARGIVLSAYGLCLADADGAAARPWLERALEAFRATENYAEAASALYVLARLADNAGDVRARDQYADAYVRMRAQEERAATDPRGDARIDALHTLVERVGARLAAGM